MQVLWGSPSITASSREHSSKVERQQTSLALPAASSQEPTPLYERVGSEVTLTEHDDEYLLCAPSDTVQALTTGGYALALRNRLVYADILPKATLDTSAWTPIFVHDVLMLPGTLGQIIGKDSETDIIDRMTPAVLGECRAVTHTKSRTPCIVVSDDAKDTVHGMLIFGQGKRARQAIAEHYACHGSQHRVARAAIEVMVPIPRASRREGGQQWGREVVLVFAIVHVWSGPELSSKLGRTWTFENFLTGRL